MRKIVEINKPYRKVVADIDGRSGIRRVYYRLNPNGSVEATWRVKRRNAERSTETGREIPASSPVAKWVFAVLQHHVGAAR
jgi:hypothetical protein